MTLMHFLLLWSLIAGMRLNSLSRPASLSNSVKIVARTQNPLSSQEELVCAQQIDKELL